MDTNASQLTQQQTLTAAESTCKAYESFTKDMIALTKVETVKSSFSQFLTTFSTLETPAVIVVYFAVYKVDANNKQQVAGYALVVLESDAESGMNEEKRSTMAETANILVGTYLASISNQSNQSLMASIQPIFKSTTGEAAKILQNQLFHGDTNKELNLTSIEMMDGFKTRLYVLLEENLEK
jgi:ribosomal protein L17